MYLTATLTACLYRPHRLRVWSAIRYRRLGSYSSHRPSPDDYSALPQRLDVDLLRHNSGNPSYTSRRRGIALIICEIFLLGCGQITLTRPDDTIASSVTVSSSSILFGTVPLGSSSAIQTVTLLNSGTAAVELSNIALSGINSASFNEKNDCGAWDVLSVIAMTAVE